jgi:hypothetical protein
MLTVNIAGEFFACDHISFSDGNARLLVAHTDGSYATLRVVPIGDIIAIFARAS